jgi:tRNA uridine 5-carbamoylmethylation protein Kti12
MFGVRKNKPVTRSEGQQQRPSDSLTVEEMEVADKAMGRKNSRNDKYRQLCEGMRDLMQEFPQAKKRMETLMRLMNGIIQDTGKMAAEDARQAVNRDADNLRGMW